ncbi:hypothetical protein CYMTET_52471 [Cymbomonas tetramitiformis]|uniref:Uncharacterized protein n=1 Tax=Cymbomonas tetramitiformis TaxID=36881 RepID=A0AAE0BKD0_9CHLO|nr:hypothetical protein CYMTET_52471 [Cymbomonas tetramitiformis]
MGGWRGGVEREGGGGEGGEEGGVGVEKGSIWNHDFSTQWQPHTILNIINNHRLPSMETPMERQLERHPRWLTRSLGHRRLWLTLSPK